MDVVVKVIRSPGAATLSSFASQSSHAAANLMPIEEVWNSSVKFGSCSTNSAIAVKAEYVEDFGLLTETDGCFGDCAKRIKILLKDASSAVHFHLLLFGPFAEEWAKSRVQKSDIVQIFNPMIAKRETTYILHMGSPVQRDNYIVDGVARKIVISRRTRTRLHEAGSRPLALPVAAVATDDFISPPCTRAKDAAEKPPLGKVPGRFLAEASNASKAILILAASRTVAPTAAAARQSTVRYATLSECTDVSKKVKYNVFAVVTKVSRLPAPTKSGKFMSQVYLRDPDYKGSDGFPDFQFSMFSSGEWHFPDISIGSVLRIHHMAMEWYGNKLTGRVFDVRAVALVGEAERRDQAHVPSHSSTNFEFTADDERKVNELISWWQNVIKISNQTKVGANFTMDKTVAPTAVQYLTPSTQPKYAMLSECTDVSRMVKYNVFAVVTKVSRLPTPTKSGKFMSQVYIRDPDYKGSYGFPDFQFSMLSSSEEHFLDISIGSVLRIHHMAMEWYLKELTGRVFDVTSVALVGEAERRDQAHIPSHSSNNFAFTADDEHKVNELIAWWQNVIKMSDLKISDLTEEIANAGGKFTLTVSVLAHLRGKQTDETVVRVTDGTENYLSFASLDKHRLDSEDFDPTFKRRRLHYDIFVHGAEHCEILRSARPGRKVKISGISLEKIKDCSMEHYQLIIKRKQPIRIEVLEAIGVDTLPTDTFDTFVSETEPNEAEKSPQRSPSVFEN